MVHHLQHQYIPHKGVNVRFVYLVPAICNQYRLQYIYSIVCTAVPHVGQSYIHHTETPQQCVHNGFSHNYMFIAFIEAAAIPSIYGLIDICVIRFL